MGDFKAKSEKEIEQGKLFEPGVYDFEVVRAVRWTSQESGKDSLKVTLLVYLADRKQYVGQYLSSSEKMQFLLRHFCDCLEILPAYESESFDKIADAAAGKSGKAKFYIQEDKKGNFPPKNQVRDFLKRADFGKYATGGVVSSNVVKQETPFDDDIPY